MNNEKNTMEEMKKMLQERRGASQSRPKPKEEPKLKEHTVASGESLSAIALKYYNSADRDKWMAIYEANKEAIGDNPSAIRPGQVLKIPEL